MHPFTLARLRVERFASSHFAEESGQLLPPGPLSSSDAALYRGAEAFLRDDPPMGAALYDLRRTSSSQVKRVTR